MPLGSTPWVDRNFRAMVGALQEKVPKSWLRRFAWR